MDSCFRRNDDKGFLESALQIKQKITNEFDFLRVSVLFVVPKDFEFLSVFAPLRSNLRFWI